MRPPIRHLSFTHYLTYDQLTELVHDLAAAWPEFVRLHAIGGNAVPAPGALALLGAAALVRRRRR